MPIILILGLITGVYLVQSNKLQIFKSKASNEPITPVGSTITKDGDTWQTTSPTVEFELNSPLAPASP